MKYRRRKSGRRIEGARLLFGSATSPTNSGGSGSSESESQMVLWTEPYKRGERELMLFHSNREVRRELMSVQAEVSRVRIPADTCRVVLMGGKEQFSLPASEKFWMDFGDWEGGRRSEAEVVMYTALLLIGARGTSHPAILGVPSSRSLPEVWADSSSCSYGTMRASACRDLTMKAVEIYDKGGLMRSNALESVIAALMLEGTLDCGLDHAEETAYERRAYVLSTIGHFRQLMTDPATPQEVRSVMHRRIGPMIFGRDAMTAMQVGDRPALTSGMIEVIFKHSQYGVERFLDIDIDAPPFVFTMPNESEIYNIIVIRIATLQRYLMNNFVFPLRRLPGSAIPQLLEQLLLRINKVEKELQTYREAFGRYIAREFSSCLAQLECEIPRIVFVAHKAALAFGIQAVSPSLEQKSRECLNFTIRKLEEHLYDNEESYLSRLTVLGHVYAVVKGHPFLSQEMTRCAEREREVMRGVLCSLGWAYFSLDSEWQRTFGHARQIDA
ncbi:hypothetical protein BT69DRAFT_1350603 [Atractiella rhizophila]|nr:hypothetical protein BT69DRAFT_1350603 [Atractiella rhizophila]